MPPKIARDAFLYLEPKTAAAGQDFAQCGPCRMFVPGSYVAPTLKGGRCILHGAKVEIDEDDSCGFMVPWPDVEPVDSVIRDHAAELVAGIAPSVTPDESGLVDRLVQCKRCLFPRDAAVTRCGLYEDLNAALPAQFALDPTIEPDACCNAQTPRDEGAGDSAGDSDLAAAEAAIRLFFQRTRRWP